MYDKDAVTQTVRSSTSNPANGYREEIRHRQRTALLEAVDSINTSASSLSHTMDLESAHAVAHELARDINTYLIGIESEQFQSIFGLTEPDLQENVKNFVARYQNSTDLLGRGLSQQQIEAGIESAGFNKVALELESDATVYLESLAKRSYSSSNYHLKGISDFNVYEKGRVQDESTFYNYIMSVYKDIVRDLLEPYRSTSTETHRTNVVNVCCVALQFFLAAHRQLALMKETFCHKLYTLSPSLLQASQSNQEFPKIDGLQFNKELHMATQVIQQANMLVLFHAQSGLFSLGVYLRFFVDHILVKGNSVIDEQFYSALKQKDLLPFSYAKKEALAINQRLSDEIRLPAQHAELTIEVLIRLWREILPENVVI